MRLVQFDDGKYGVRSYWLFGWRFVDLENPYFHWEPGDKFFKCCMGEREEAERILAYSTGKHRAVKR